MFSINFFFFFSFLIALEEGGLPQPRGLLGLPQGRPCLIQTSLKTCHIRLFIPITIHVRLVSLQINQFNYAFLLPCLIGHFNYFVSLSLSLSCHFFNFFSLRQNIISFSSSSPLVATSPFNSANYYCASNSQPQSQSSSVVIYRLNFSFINPISSLTFKTHWSLMHHHKDPSPLNCSIEPLKFLIFLCSCFSYLFSFIYYYYFIGLE